MNYELWRPALIAFYKADGWFVSAENLEKHHAAFTIEDKRVIRSLAAALEFVPDVRIAA